MAQQSRVARVSVFVDDEWLTCDGADPAKSWEEIEEELNQVLRQLFAPHAFRTDIFGVVEEWEGEPQVQEPRFDRRR